MASYVRLNWKHASPEFPIAILSELDSERWETRKIEFFADGTVGYAQEGTEAGGSFLGEKPVPDIEIMNRDAEFEAEEISATEFEKAWRQASEMPVRSGWE